MSPTAYSPPDRTLCTCSPKTSDDRAGERVSCPCHLICPLTLQNHSTEGGTLSAHPQRTLTLPPRVCLTLLRTCSFGSLTAERWGSWQPHSRALFSPLPCALGRVMQGPRTGPGQEVWRLAMLLKAKPRLWNWLDLTVTLKAVFCDNSTTPPSGSAFFLATHWGVLLFSSLSSPLSQ